MILAGCGKKHEKPAPDSAPPAAAATGVTVSATATGPPPPEAAAPAPAPVAGQPAETPEPEVVAANYARRLREVEAAEHDTDFMKAIALCKAMLNDFRERDRTKALTATMNRLIDERRRSADLAFAIQSLGSNQYRVRKVAAGVLSKADDVGLMFLRHAWRTKEDPIALEAGRLLIEWGDKGALQGFVDTIGADPDSPLARRAAEGLVSMVESLDKELVRACFDTVGKDTNFVAATAFDVLEAVFSQACARDETAFNRLAGHPDGMDALRRHVATALLSDKPETVAWACECIPEVLPLRSGFRVRYYPNTEFDGAVIDPISLYSRFHSVLPLC